MKRTGVVFNFGLKDDVKKTQDLLALQMRNWRAKQGFTLFHYEAPSIESKIGFIESSSGDAGETHDTLIDTSDLFMPDSDSNQFAKFETDLNFLFDDKNLLCLLYPLFHDVCPFVSKLIGRPLGDLLYLSSRDGCANEIFHLKCDNRGASVLLVKLLTGHIFGGFVENSWSSGGGTADSGARSFLFSLTDGRGRAPVVLPSLSAGQAPVSKYGMGCSRLSGPHLGLYDLSVNLDNKSLCRTNIGRTFTPPPGTIFGSREARSFLAGSYDEWGAQIADVYIYSVV